MGKSKQKYVHKVEEARDLNLGEMIYIGIISQNNPSSVVCKNLSLIQDSDTKHR